MDGRITLQLRPAGVIYVSAEWVPLLNGTVSCLMTADSKENLWITFTIVGLPVYMPTLLHKYTPVVHIQISKPRM